MSTFVQWIILTTEAFLNPLLKQYGTGNKHKRPAEQAEDRVQPD